MEEKDLIKIIRCGETSAVQFKQKFDNQDKIAAEIIAMANAKGGMIIFGIEDKTGTVVGMEYAELQYTSNKISTVEIVSPGCLPNSLTVENIKLGNAVIRNNLLASYSSKLIKHKINGFGSGIPRAMEEQPNIELINDTGGNQFIVKIPREYDKI